MMTRTGALVGAAMLAVIVGTIAASRARGSDTPLWQRDSIEQLVALPLPLPDSLRSGATLVGVNAHRQRTVLRKGNNGLVCTIFAPGEDSFDVRCYHESFMPVIDARWDLAAKGARFPVVQQQLDSLIAAKSIILPEHPTAGYRMLGPARAFSAATSHVSKEIERWESLHVPYRTAAELGLPSEEQGGALYVMSGGTYWAHVMIMHPK